MKNALILHGTNADHTHNWFPWLKKKLENEGWKVWVPDLPGADYPNIDRYNNFLLSHKNWEASGETIIIGHSSGAVEILGLLNKMSLPEGVKLRACFLVGVFRGDLGWQNLKGMAQDFDFAAIKNKCKKFVFVHSDNDPYCPLEHARYLSKKLGGELIIIPGQQHFTTSLDPSYTEFPRLFKIIEEKA